jgi:hypothetical protein
MINKILSTMLLFLFAADTAGAARGSAGVGGVAVDGEKGQWGVCLCVVEVSFDYAVGLFWWRRR